MSKLQDIRDLIEEYKDTIKKYESLIKKLKDEEYRIVMCDGVNSATCSQDGVLVHTDMQNAQENGALQDYLQKKKVEEKKRFRDYFKS